MENTVKYTWECSNCRASSTSLTAALITDWTCTHKHNKLRFHCRFCIYHYHCFSIFSLTSGTNLSTACPKTVLAWCFLSWTHQNISKCKLCNMMREVCHHLPAAAYRHRADPPEQREAPTSKNPTSKNIHINHCKTDLYQSAAFSF